MNLMSAGIAQGGGQLIGASVLAIAKEEEAMKLSLGSG